MWSRGAVGVKMEGELSDRGGNATKENEEKYENMWIYTGCGLNWYKKNSTF